MSYELKPRLVWILPRQDKNKLKEMNDPSRHLLTFRNLFEWFCKTMIYQFAAQFVNLAKAD